MGGKTYWKRICLGLMLIATRGQSQDLHFYGALPVVSQTEAITKHWSYNLFVSTTFDLIHRQINQIDYPVRDLQFYIQPSIIYQIKPRWNAACSYTYQRNNPFNELFVNEHRLWEQLVHTIPLGCGQSTQRIRLEERFIENKALNIYPLSTRVRTLLGYMRPLQGKTLDLHEVYINAYNDAYFSISGAKNATYSEDWVYAGCGYQLSPHIGRIEVGLMMQALVRNPQHDIRYLHLMQIMWMPQLNVLKHSKNS